MIEPDFTIERFLAGTPLERESDRIHYAQGLRLAGIPEDEIAHQAERLRATAS